MRRLLLLLALLLLPGQAAAASADAGWEEAVVSVADLDDRVAFFRNVIGWEVVARGPVGRSQLDAWRLPRHATAQTALLRSPGAERGFIRLVAFGNVGEAPRVRSSARPWEAGGWAGLNVRVRSIDAVFARLQRSGWQSFSDPVTFTVPPYRVREVMVVGPDGLTLSLIERLDPPLVPNWSSLWSPAVTVFEADADPAASRLFYGGRLGLQAWLTYDGPAAEPGANLFGLPHDVVGRVTREVSWWRAQGRGDGTIATLAFRGITGQRFAPGALAPPRLGLFLISLRVTDAALRCRRLAEQGVGIIHPAAIIDRPGTGPSDSCTLATPSGSWLELYQPR